MIWSEISGCSACARSPTALGFERLRQFAAPRLTARARLPYDCTRGRMGGIIKAAGRHQAKLWIALPLSDLSGAGAKEGDIREVPVTSSGFPVDKLLVLILPSAHSEYSASFFASAIPKLLSRVESAGLASVVIPPIGYRWESQRTF